MKSDTQIITIKIELQLKIYIQGDIRINQKD